MEISEELVNRCPTSLYTSFVSVDFGKNGPGKICQTVAQHSDVQIEGELLLYNFILYLQQTIT